jgi:hypothetical protein
VAGTRYITQVMTSQNFPYMYVCDENQIYSNMQKLIYLLNIVTAFLTSCELEFTCSVNEGLGLFNIFLAAQQMSYKPS